jgi:hypothetical protein
MHQNLKWSSKIEEASLKLKNQKLFLFRLDKSKQAYKNAQISCDNLFKEKVLTF